MHSRPCHALMREPFSMFLFENKHNTWLLRSILLKHRCKSSFIQNYIKIKICVFIAVKYICVMVFKSLNGQAPEYLLNLLTKCSETNVRSLRSSKQETLKVPFARTTYYEKSFSVTGPKLWDSLPIQIRQSSNLITFKQSVKSFYLSEQLNDP